MKYLLLPLLPIYSAAGIRHTYLGYPLLPDSLFFINIISLLLLPVHYLGTAVQILLSFVDFVLSTHLNPLFSLIFFPILLSKLTYLITSFCGSTEYYLLVSVNVKTSCNF